MRSGLANILEQVPSVQFDLKCLQSSLFKQSDVCLASPRVSLVLVPAPQVALASFPKALPYGSLSRLVLLRTHPFTVAGGRSGLRHRTARRDAWSRRCVPCLCPPDHAHMSVWETLDAEAQTVTPNHLSSFWTSSFGLPSSISHIGATGNFGRVTKEG